MYDRCWRCHQNRVRLPGMPCPSCREILERDYDARRAANGGRLLYLPSTGALPLMATLPTTTASRMCSECARDFTFIPGLGRPPLRCPSCRQENPLGPARRTAVVSAKAVVKQAVSVPDVLPLPTASAPPPLDLPAFTEQVMREIDALESALAVRLRVVRSLEAYARVTDASRESPGT